jgi:hypothetical protein
VVQPPPPYGPPPAGDPGQPPYGQPPYGQPPYGQPPYGQPPYGQPPYGQPPYGQPPYGQPPYGNTPPYPPMRPVTPDPYYAAFAPKPGCVPLRPLGLGDILDGSFKVIRRNPRATLGLSAIVAVLQSCVLIVLQLFAFSQLSNAIDNSNPNNTRVNVGNLISGEGTAFIGAFVGSIFAAVLAGMLTVVITEDVLGKKLDISAVWARIRPRLWRLIGLSLVVGIVPFVGLAFCIVPGVWLWGTWAVAVPALVVEGAGVGRSLGRSRALVSGTFWRVWGIRALGVGMVTLVGGFIAVPFAVVGAAVSGGGGLFNANGGQSLSVPVAYVLITAVGSVIATTLTAPVRAGIDALLYVDLRMRKEGLDIVLQQAAAKLPANRAGYGANPGAQGGWR